MITKRDVKTPSRFRHVVPLHGERRVRFLTAFSLCKCHIASTCIRSEVTLIVVGSLVTATYGFFFNRAFVLRLAHAYSGSVSLLLTLRVIRANHKFAGL